MRFLSPLLCFCAFFLFSSGSANEPVRTWTNTEGKQVKARMLSQTGDTVTVLLVDGRTFIIPVSTLSEEDQSYLKKKDAPSTLGPDEGWFLDAEEAKKAAAGADRLVLMLFTGSDWCGYCIKLEDTVLSKSSWKSFAEENLVLLKVDFPRRKKIAASQLDANRDLQQTYKIRGYPTMVLTDASGKQLDQFGYGGQSPSAFISFLKKKLP